MRLDDKVAIVTGSGQGIGETYAKSIAAAGASVVVAEIQKENGLRVADEIVAAGGKAVFVEVDVASAESTAAMAQAATEAFGGIDYLVNNAAIFHSMKAESLLKVDWEYYRRFMDVNMDGALRCVRACYPSMRKRGGGSIVNQSSTAAWMAAGYYSLAKLAINGLTQCLARELGGMNIRVNAIAPGPTDTEAMRSVVPEAFMDHLLAGMPMPRLGQPADLVGVCLFLLSDHSAWMTGQVVNVDGGQIMRP